MLLTAGLIIECTSGKIPCNFRSQYRVDAQAAYQQKMLKAFAGKGDYPKIRTFNKSGISTNSVYKDLEAAEKMYVILSIVCW